MKSTALALLAAGGVAAALVASPTAPEPAVEPDPVNPSAAVCPVEEGSGRSSELSVLASVDGPVDLALFGGGERASGEDVATGPTGSVTVAASELGAVGQQGALVEMPVASFATGVVVAGPSSLSAEGCLAVTPPRSVFLSGGSTTEGRGLELLLLNPFGGEALVELAVQSEAGLESNERFDAVVVPAQGTAFLDITRLIPGRNTVSIAVETVSGNVFALATQRAGGENATWQAVQAGADWYLPIPPIPGSRVVLATPVNTQVDYQLDLYDSGGVTESWQSGTLTPRGSVTIDLADLENRPAAIRVIADGPLVPTLWVESDAGLAATTGVPDGANTWLLPGAGSVVGGDGHLVIVNIGVDEAQVTVRRMREGSTQAVLVVGTDQVVELPLAAARGYRVDSDGPVVAMWATTRGGAAVAAMGVPLRDG